MEEKELSGEAVILNYSIKHGGDWDEQLKAITQREPFERKEVAQNYNKYNGQFITMININYPEYLKGNRNAPPFVLYYKGDVSLIKEYKDKLSVFVGLSASMYAKNSVSKLLKEMMDKVVPVIPYTDRWSLDTAVEISSLGGRVVLVLSKGFGQLDEYEKESVEKIRERGLVLTELPDEEKDKKKTKIQQCRLVANLAINTLVGAVTKKEYQMVGLGYSLAKGDSVFCIPFQMGSNYINNSLIHDGAILVENTETILYDGGFSD